NWSAQFGEMLMPKVANGIDLVWNLHQAHSENIEFQFHPKLLGSRTTTIRLLSYINHANMGVYKNAIQNYLDGLTPTPEIAAHPWKTTMKYGFDINVEKFFAHNIRGFSRWGWNEGQHESFAYTEDDETFSIGADVSGDAWRRKFDRVGTAFVTNGISAYHQRYLQLGGLGFILGDGGLNYGRETISETYYNVHVWRGLFVSPNLQHIDNPGYNRDRGPVWVTSMRFHLEF
ncbi:MAG TPA: carbohydrate porin, partial [Terriglobales bacterium]